MEILITSFCLTTILVLTILIATRGRPMRFFTAFGETLKILWTNKRPVLLMLLTTLSVLGFLYYYYTPSAADIGPEQPIAFSHQLHAGIKNIQCRFCHPYVERSIHPGLPPVEKCLYCHNYIIPNHPEILKEHEYYNKNIPTPWRKAFYLSEHVLFNHERHIKKEVRCESCHGKVETMDRIKGERFKMQFCIECHRSRNVNLDCWLACHS
ncbi:MAG: cytochrome c3 family protein [Desulfobacteraceae bacterium]